MSMSIESRKSSIKRAQKEAALFRIVAQLLHQATIEEPLLSGLFMTRVVLSPGKTLCTAYVYTAQGATAFEAMLEQLKLFKPSMRKAIADTMQARYTVELVFRFDDTFEKAERIERLLDQIKEEAS